MMRMLEAGEDPLFVARRMVIFAAEDVGNAEPQALQVAVAAKDAVHFVGLPEGRIPLAQAATFLATAPSRTRPIARMLAAAADVQRAGRAARPAPPAQRADAAHEGSRLRRRLPVPARLRGGHGRSSSTCPTSSPVGATTSRPTAGASARSASGCAPGAPAVPAARSRHPADLHPTADGISKDSATERPPETAAPSAVASSRDVAGRQ